jgi:hypothetical protein
LQKALKGVKKPASLKTPSSSCSRPFYPKVNGSRGRKRRDFGETELRRNKGEKMNRSLITRKIFTALMAVALLSSCGKGCSKGGMGGGGGGKVDPLDVIPANSNLLISLNLKKMQTMPMFADMMKDAPQEAKDMSKDMDSAVLALTMRGPAEPPSGLAIVTGNFDEPKVVLLLEDAAKKQGGEVKKETFEGKTLYLSPKDPSIGMAFLAPNEAMWGQVATLKDAITLASKKGESVRSNKELMDLYNKRDDKKMLYGVGLIPPGVTPPAQPGDPMASLQGIKAFSLGIDYDNQNLSIDLTANAQDANQAQSLTNMINSYKTIFGTTLASQQPAVGQIIQGANITNQDKSITISLKVSDAVLKQLSQMVAEKKAGAGAPMGMPGDPSMPPPPSAPAPGLGAAPAMPAAPAPAPSALPAPAPTVAPAAPAAPAPMVAPAPAVQPAPSAPPAPSQP